MVETIKTNEELFEEARALIGTPEEVRGVQLMTDLAEQGDMCAQAALGIMYTYGNGVEKDSELAYKWYKLAADQGEVNAIAGLGECYLLGNGILKDFNKAMELLLDAAQNGSAFAMCLLGDIYLGYDFDGVYTYQETQGPNGHRSVTDAIVWFTRAAQLGNEYAIEKIKMLCD